MDIKNDFQPMPKRFMVCDKNSSEFLTVRDAYPKCQFSEDEKNKIIFSLQDLIALFSEYLYYDNSDNYVVCQSTNLFDKDDEEIFEGSVVRDFDDAIGVVYYDLEDGGYRAKSANEDSFELADSSCDLKVLGHILSNSELLEENEQFNNMRY